MDDSAEQGTSESKNIIAAQSNPKPKPNTTAELHIEAIGTRWLIELPGRADFPKDLIADIQNVIEAFNGRWSRFRQDSFVTRLSHEAGNYILPEEAQPMFDLYRQLYKLTDGLVTPLIGQALSDDGNDTNHTLPAHNSCPAPPWEDTFAYNFPKLTMYQPALLDFGAGGKGHLIDLISEIIENHRITEYLVDGGGGLRVRAPLATDIGLKHPDNNSTFVGTAHVKNQSLCSSAGNRHTEQSGVMQHNHGINPRTAISPEHIRALWVVADTTLLANGLATALFFVSPQLLAKHFDFEYAIIGVDYSLQHSAAFPADFHTQT